MRGRIRFDSKTEFSVFILFILSIPVKYKIFGEGGQSAMRAWLTWMT